MKDQTYKFTIEQLEETKADVLVFEASTRDDLFKIVEKMKTKSDFNEEDAAAFGVGLKLFGEVVMKNKEKELFKQFKPHFVNFMKEFKKA